MCHVANKPNSPTGVNADDLNQNPFVRDRGLGDFWCNGDYRQVSLHSGQLTDLFLLIFG